MVLPVEFEAEIGPLRAALELRRKKYLRYFYGGIAVSVGMLATALVCPEDVLLGIERLFHMKAALAASDIVAYRIFSVLLTLGLCLGPLLSYPGRRRFSVARVVFTRLLGLFGAFTLAPGGGIAISDIRKVGLFSVPPLLHPEEGAIGEINGLRVRLTDALLFHREEGRDRLVFKGLLLFCESRAGMTAQNVLANERLTMLAVAATAAADFSASGQRKDEKIVYVGAGVYARLKNAVLNRMGKEELPAEKQYRLQHMMAVPLSRGANLKPGEAICVPYSYEQAGSGAFAAIAMDRPLFTLGSLFAPALSEAHMRCLCEAMAVAKAFTAS